MWFHCLLFVCAIWAIFGFADFAVGFFIATLPIRISSEIRFTSKLIQRRVALGVKAFSICTSPVMMSSHSVVQGRDRALLSPQCTVKL